MPDQARTEREARLAAALRENLKRRKAQARARAEAAADAGPAAPAADEGEPPPGPPRDTATSRAE